MSAGPILAWLIAIVPCAWLFWSRKGLAAPSFRFPRDPLLGSPLSSIPDVKCLLIAAAMGCFAATLIWTDPVQQRASTLFLIDNSASMADPSLDANAKITTKLKLGTGLLSDLAASAGEFQQVDPGRTALVRFSAMPRVIQPLTDDGAAVGRAIAQLEPEKTPLDAETNMVDGLIEALVRINAVASPSRTIVLWTDGEANVRDTASGWSLTQAAMAIRALGVKLIVADAGPEELDSGDPGFAERERAKRLLARLVTDAEGVALTRLDAAELLTLFPKATPRFDRTGPRLILSITGLFLSFLGLFLYWRTGDLKRFIARGSALGRSVFWPPGALACYRRFGLLALAAWLCAFASAVLLFLGWSRSGEALGIWFDVRPSMLAGQPSRMELARRYLDRSLQSPAMRTYLLGGRARPVEAWIMAAEPVRLFAPTFDLDAIRDEWERLETWAEDPALFAKSTPAPSTGRLSGPILWVSDGANSPPESLTTSRAIGVLAAIGANPARLERGGQAWTFAANERQLADAAGWGPRFSLGDPPDEIAKWLVQTNRLAGPYDRILLAMALGLLVLTMLPGVAREYTTKEIVNTKRPALALATALMLVMPGLVDLGGLAHAQESLQEARVEMEKARQALLRIKETPLASRLALLDEVLKDLDKAARLGGSGEPNWKLLRFLALAHKRDLLQKASLPPEGGPGQDDRPSTPTKNTENDPQSGKKLVPFDGPLPRGEVPTKSADVVPGGLIAAGAPLERELGLYDQLLFAQRKIAAESTTRRLSRIIPREWSEGEAPR